MGLLHYLLPCGTLTPWQPPSGCWDPHPDSWDPSRGSGMVGGTQAQVWHCQVCWHSPPHLLRVFAATSTGSSPSN